MSATVLVIGTGGREHALAYKLAQSPLVGRVLVGGVPTAADAASGAKLQELPADMPSPGASAAANAALAGWCKDQGVALVVIGPEQPLADGLVDALEAAQVPAFGPTQAAAQVEANKAFAKQVMVKNNIPTAAYAAFTSEAEAHAYIDAHPAALVVKASGLAAGKGVVVAKDQGEAKAAVTEMLSAGRFGAAGEQVVVEELMTGPEISLLCFVAGDEVAAMPPIQDHKRLLDGDAGPNTGGMGVYGPCPLASADDLVRIDREILRPMVRSLQAEGAAFNGILYCGLMLTPDGPKVVEWNCRGGDPETQALCMLLDSDLYPTMRACSPLCPERLADHMPVFAANRAAAVVVLASKGYPEAYPKGLPITIDAQRLPTGVEIFHAGTKRSEDGQIVTWGGRVLAVTAVADSLQAAVDKAYEGVACVKFEGAVYRNDIAWQCTSRQPSLTYAGAGVDISAGNALVEAIKGYAKSTRRAGCDASLGGFGGLFDLAAAGFKDPVLVSGTDGVGTKLLLAQACRKHDCVGIDLVAMCVNDILAQGAEPLFFLDYFATGHLSVEEAADVVKGVADGCRQAGCALVGGETAEMPGLYKAGEYDMAGFAVGAVERTAMLPRLEDVAVGDCVIGLASSGVHSNGFSLVRRVAAVAGLAFTDPAPFAAGQTLGEALLAPTKIYVKALLPAMRRGLVTAFAHITGGGLVENIPRVLPASIGVDIDADKWAMPAVFRWLKAQGNVALSEMARTFNCGLGGVIICKQADTAELVKALRDAGEDANVIGKTTAWAEDSGEPQVQVRNLDKALVWGKPVVRPAPVVKKRVGVLISGSGTNMQALVKASREQAEYPAEIVLVVSNVATAAGIDKARALGIAVEVIPHKDYASRQAFEEAIDKTLRAANVELVCLAGFMRILTEWFVQRWEGALLNTHPSLLPSFKGMHAHRLVLEAGARITGCTVHYVAPDVDAGAIVAQAAVPVESGDTEETLQERVKVAEHSLYPRALAIVARGEAPLGADKKICW